MAWELARTGYRLWQRGGARALWLAFERRIRSNALWEQYSFEASILAEWYDFSEADITASKAVQHNSPGHLQITSISWFIPDFVHPFYGGIHTVLRFADHLWREYNVQNQFVVVGRLDTGRLKSRIIEAFPTLTNAQVVCVGNYDDLKNVDATDAAVATLWNTAYYVLRFNTVGRKFYFMQDYEPLFYPAGSIYAQAEATYRFGFHGLANTPSLKVLYEELYDGRAESFMPCVDDFIFAPRPIRTANSSRPYRVFFYGRPHHPRNGFELAAAALRLAKGQLGERVDIVSAGARWNPSDYGLQGVVRNLGLLGYAETAELYRTCDVGLVLMFTRHPSYLPLELMASGALVVTNYNPATLWLLRNQENCLLSEASASCLAETLQMALRDSDQRKRITQQAVSEIRARYNNWGQQIDMIYSFMCEPEAHPLGLC